MISVVLSVYNTGGSENRNHQADCHHQNHHDAENLFH